MTNFLIVMNLLSAAWSVHLGDYGIATANFGTFLWLILEE